MSSSSSEFVKSERVVKYLTSAICCHWLSMNMRYSDPALRLKHIKLKQIKTVGNFEVNISNFLCSNWKKCQYTDRQLLVSDMV